MLLPLREFSAVVSALKQASAELGSTEGRRTPRMVVAARVTLHIVSEGKVLRSYTAWTRDISVGGLGLIQSVELPVGQDVIVTLPRQNAPLRALAKVARSMMLADGIYSAALEFVAILARPEPNAAAPTESKPADAKPAAAEPADSGETKAA